MSKLTFLTLFYLFSQTYSAKTKQLIADELLPDMNAFLQVSQPDKKEEKKEKVGKKTNTNDDIVYYSKQEALSHCVPCLKEERTKFCTDGTKFQCCKTYQKNGICNNTDNKKITCSDSSHEIELQKFKVCPSSEDFCGKKEIKMNSDKEFEIAGLPENHICKYNVQLENKKFDNIFKLVVEERQAVEVGMYYRSRWLENKGHTEVGFIGEGKCLIANNCTLDSSNQYSYYLSNTEEVSLIVMADEKITKEEPALLLMQMSKEELSNDKVPLYIVQIFIILAVSIFGFVFGMKLIIPKSQESASSLRFREEEANEESQPLNEEVEEAQKEEK